MSKEEDIFRQKVYRYQIEGLNDQQIESYNLNWSSAASARRLSDYGFLHSKGRQLDSQSADTELTVPLPGTAHGGSRWAVPC